jgi:hypothetical protein
MKGGTIIASARTPPGNPGRDPGPHPEKDGPVIANRQANISVFSLFPKGTLQHTESSCPHPHLPKMNREKFKLKTPRKGCRYRKYWFDATTGKKFFIDSDPLTETPQNSQSPSHNSIRNNWKSLSDSR